MSKIEKKYRIIFYLVIMSL